MPGDGESISIVLLSYNRPRYLERALASIAAQSVRPSEVLVVDNRSAASEEIARIVGAHRSFKLIANPANTGFTGGMNIGIRRATEPYIYLTEDDVVLEANCLASFADHSARSPAVGLLSGILIDDERDTILSAGGSVRVGRVYRQEIIAQGERSGAAPTAPYDVDYVPGAMVFGHRDVWKRLGGFREDFFAYGEDVDLCLRARRAGYRITIVPGARARHLPGAGAPSATVEYHKLKNFLALYLLHAPVWVLPEFLLRYVVLWSVRAGSQGKRRLMWRAAVWNARHLIGLLADRGRIRPSVVHQASS